MKIIQVNAWCGRLNGPLARFIEHEQPDLLCMQEVYDPKAQFPDFFRDQYAFANEVIQVGNFSYNFFAAAWGFEIGGTLIDIGNLILSKFPLTNLKASHTNGHYYHRSIKNVIPNTRIWQACTVKLTGKKLLSVSNYQGYVTGSDPSGDKITIKTMKKVHDNLIQLSHPIIFCGDLNIKPTSPALKVLDDLELNNLVVDYKISTTLSPAHRASEADRQGVACDYIFVSDEVKVKDFRASDEIVSDHKALILEFDL